MASLESITDKISTTNNGKLLLRNLTTAERKLVNGLVKSGDLQRATFMTFADSIRLA